VCVRLSPSEMDITDHKVLKKKNLLLGIVEDHPLIQRKKLIALCLVNFGWSKRWTKEYIDLLIDFGSLTLDTDDRLQTAAHTHNFEQQKLEVFQEKKDLLNGE
jgi:hypothetical protein